MNYKIGSFNVRNLSEKNEYVKDKLDIISKIIRKERIDIIALQEVLFNGDILDGGLGRKLVGQPKVYDAMLRRMLHGYDVRWGASNVKKGGDKRGEGYAFIWNKRRIELAKHLTPIGEKTFNPRIWGHYNLQESGAERRLKRDPFYGRFKLKNTRQEIRLITTHMYYGSNTGVDIGERRQELDILAGNIYPRLNDKRYGVNTPSITILLGDYNLNLLESGAGSPYLQNPIAVNKRGFVCDYDSNRSNLNLRTIRTFQNQKSTLSSNSEDEEYSNNYDHISYERNEGWNFFAHNEKAIGEPYVIRVSDMPGIDFEEYREKVSDHLPICVELKL